MDIEARGLSGQIRFDGRSVIITRSGFFPWLAHGGAGMKSIPISSVTAVQHRRQGFYNGYLQLSVMGELERAGGRDTTQSLKNDENTVMFHFLANKAFQAMADTLRAAVDRAHSGVAAISADEAMAQIQKLGELLKSGYINLEDYEAKKQDLLSRI